MDKTGEPKKRNILEPVSWLAVGAALGYAAFATLRRKRESATEFFDVDSVMKSCEKAAAKLDVLLHDEPAQAS